MDARELTPIVEKNKDKIFLLERQVEMLTQETQKLRMIIDDMQMDVKMLQGRR